MKSSKHLFFTAALIFVLALGLAACAKETTTVETGTTDTATTTWSDTAMTTTTDTTATDTSLASSHPGQEAFTSLRCQMCHAVSTAGVTGTTDTGGDLAGVSGRRAGEDLAAFIQGDDHPGEWKGTPEQATQIAEWLGQQ